MRSVAAPSSAPAPSASPPAGTRWSSRVKGALQRDVPLVALVAAWVASRVFYYAQGVRFDTDSLDIAYQFLPRDLLEHDYWSSLWHLHMQPPLFNAFIGAMLHLPGSPSLTFGLLFRATSLLLAVMMYKLATELGVPRVPAAVVVGIFTCAPTAVFYEHYLFYTLPVATLLVFATWSLLRWLRTGRDRYGLGFFLAATSLALTRASYHLVWVAAIVVFGIWASRGRTPARRAALLALPTLLVPALYVKNAAQFGTFSASSWQGMNLARIALVPADDAKLQRMVDDGELSRDARVTPFASLRDYGTSHTPTGVPALDRLTRDARHRDPNLNNLDYVDISKQYQRDSLTYIRDNPVEYGGSVLAATRLFFLPSSYNPQVGNNMLKLYDITKANWLFPDLQPKRYESILAFTQPKRHGPGYWQVSYTAVLLYGLVLIGGPILLWRNRRNDVLDPGARRTLVFACATVGFAFLSETLVELGENNRFRFETDPLVWVSAAAIVAIWWRARVARRHATT
jgi:hypothetical protein